MTSFATIYAELYVQFQHSIFPQVLTVLITISPIVLLFLLATIFFPLWIDYVRGQNFLSLKYTVLEIKLPKETVKSPVAMELFLHSLNNTSDGSYFKRFWLGETRPWYSLELISIEGKVKFMIWTEDRRKNGVISGLYAQFPGIEVAEVPDYASSVQYDKDSMKMYACQFELTQKVHAYPIKTYIDYGLDKDPKEEFKVDPITPLIEYLNNVGPNQQVWIQILIQGHKGDQGKDGFIFKKTDEWRDAAKAEVDKILVRDPKTKVSGKVDAEGNGQRVTITPGEQDTVKAIERSLTKLPFDVGIRAMYLSKKETFDAPNGIGGILSSFKAFSAEGMNGFKPNGKKWIAKIDAPWQDYNNIRRTKVSKEFLLAYKMRSYFYTPFENSSFVLTSEEIATIYHFPGSVAASPNLDRVPSKKSQAPANLPI